MLAVFRWRFLHISIPVLFSLILTACGGGSSDTTSTVSNSQNTEITTTSTTITFIHLNDLHAHLMPHADYRIVNGNKIIQSADP